LYGLSHRLAQYVVDRNENFEFFGFTEAQYNISSPVVTNLFNDYTSRFSIEQLQTYLIAINNGQQFFFENNKALEHLFLKLSTSHQRINWKSFQMKENATEQLFDVNFPRYVSKSTQFNQMEKGILYYPQVSNFPLVDFYYLDNQGNLIGIQATIAKSHKKAVSTYQMFYDLLDIPNATNLSLYYLVLPCNTNNYLKDKFTDGTFFDNVAKDAKLIKKWKSRVSFHALLPPDNFESTFSSGKVI
jgi:hypothetical protein